MAKSSREIERSSGNVFADLGLTDAGERQTKVRLAMAINGRIERRGLPQATAAALLGIGQPKVPALPGAIVDPHRPRRRMGETGA